MSGLDTSPRRFKAKLAAVVACLLAAPLALTAPQALADAVYLPTWGVLATLAGQELRSTQGGYTLRFSWTRPGEELRQEWVHPRTGKVMGSSVVVLDAASGELLEGGRSTATATGYRGKVGADGSVDFVKGNSGYRWTLGADGAVERADLKLAGGGVVAKPAPEHMRWAFAEAGTAAPGPSTPGQAAPAALAANGNAAAGTTTTTNTLTAANTTPAFLPATTLGEPIIIAMPAGGSAPAGSVASRVLELPFGIAAPGKLAAEAEVDAQGRPFRCYLFTAPPGTRVRASLTSTGFQPLLRLAPGSHCGSARSIGEAESTQGKAQLEAVIASGGNHVLLVGSRTAGATGRFLVSLDAAGMAPGAGVPVSRVAAMRAQAAAYQAVLNKRAAEEAARQKREREEARVAAAERRAAEDQRANNFKRVLEELAKAATSAPK
jgi:hypothetical protein